MPLDINRLRVSTDIMRALAHPLRLRIIKLLAGHQSACVQTIYTELAIEQSVASQHLRILRQAGLLRTERKGKFVYYVLEQERLIRAGEVAGRLAALVSKRAVVQEDAAL